MGRFNEYDHFKLINPHVTNKISDFFYLTLRGKLNKANSIQQDGMLESNPRSLFEGSYLLLLISAPFYH